MDWKEIANAPWIWICGTIQAAIGMYQAAYFVKVAINMMRKHNVRRGEINSIVRGSIITSIGPVLAEIFVMTALIVAISPGLTWQREGVGVGSVFTELTQVANAAEGAGEEFGTDNFSIAGFANAVLIMNLAGWGWMVEGILTRYLGKARELVTGGNVKRVAILGACSMLGVFSFFVVRNLLKLGGVAAASIAGAVLAMLLFKLADWINQPHLKEWALGIAMFGGMLIGKLVAG
jgi:uncharacterized membrane protein